MKVLVINCGSSSLKYQLMNPETKRSICKGLCERIGIDGSRMEYEVPAKDFWNWNKNLCLLIKKH